MDNKISYKSTILKYENYIKKHPNKAYGYYCLGRLYLKGENYNKANEFFTKAISIDKNYTFAKIGLIEGLVFEKKFIKAVDLFNTYRQEIIGKFIFKVKLVRGVSSFYEKSNFFTENPKGFFQKRFWKKNSKNLLKLVEKESANIVYKILLCMYYLKTGDKNVTVIQTLKACVYFEGLDDKMRWIIMNTLSLLGEKLFFDINIAKKFSTIPTEECTDEYVNFLFGTALVNGSSSKIASIYDSVGRYKKSLSNDLLWKYLYWGKENSIYNPSIYDCCMKLTALGWMDKVIADTLIKLKERSEIVLTDKEQKLLMLYGYVN